MIRADLLLSQALSELKKEASKEEKEDSKIERVIAILQQLVRATENQELSINVEAPNVSVNPNINIPKQDAPIIEVNVPQSPEPRVTVEPQITVNVPESPAPIINLPEPVVNVTFEAKDSNAKAEYEVEVDRSANGMIAKLRIKQL
jgi:hypothetical protein